MSSVSQCKFPGRPGCHVLLAIIGVFVALRIAAQVPPMGQILYDKLAKTEQDYREAMANGDSMQVAETCYLMGKRYSALGDYVTAQKWFIRSLRIREPRGASEAIGKVYLRMAENQVIQNQHQLAVNYTQRAVYNFQQVHSLHGMMSAYIMVGGLYNPDSTAQASTRITTSVDSTLYYFRKAEQIAITLKKPLDIANVSLLLGKVLTEQGNAQGLPYLKKSYALNLQTGLAYGIINSSLALANWYIAARQPVQAKKWLDLATFVRDTAKHGDYRQNKELHELYSSVYQQTDQWKLAFEHQQKHFLAHIEALNADREGAIARAGFQYESEKKEAQLKEQQKELALRHQNLRNQQLLTLLIMALFLITGIACAVYYWLFRKYRRLSDQNAKLVKEQNHRVKNNLQSITNLLGLQFNRLTDEAARNAVEESLLRVEAMALVHQRLYDGDRLVEIDLVQYIPELVGGVLRSFNYGYVRPSYTLPALWLDADIAINLGLLLNELVTNACKYAFPAGEDPALEIGYQDDNGTFQLWVSDNGPGFTAPVKKNSFGMKLIDMITQKLKGQSHFRSENGCHFTLTFDLPVLTPSS